MKKAQRILSLASALALAALLTGCGAKTPQDVYADAVKKQSELKDMHTISDIDMDVSFMGVSMPVAMTVDMLAKNSGQSDMQMQMDMSMEMMGMTLDMGSYYADGWMYMDVLDTKAKTEMPLEDAMGQQMQLDLSGLDTENMVELTMEDGEEGAKVLHFTVDGQLLTDSLSQITGELGQDISSAELGVCDITLTVGKDGYFRQMDCTMPITIETAGTPMDMEMTMSTQFVDPGQPVEITPPVDLDSYVEGADTHVYM